MTGETMTNDKSRRQRLLMQSFSANISDDVIEDLRSRLRRTRWPDQLEGQDWRQGTELSFLQRFCEYWAERFNWREAELQLNALPQFRAVVDSVGLHLVHVRSEKPDAVPLLLVNGWPSSIFEYLHVIPRLTAAGFHVVAPALPGYGFSDRPTKPGMNGTRISALFVTLMSDLGYKRFVAHGSDWGSLVVDRIRRHHPGRLLGMHLSNVFWNYPHPKYPTPEEQAYFGKAQGWQFAEGAYALIQGTKPQTLSYGLHDSPAGLAAWIIEKYRSWSDGDVEQRYGLDALCANLTLYWATGTIGSSMRLYAESFSDPEGRIPPERGTVPVGVTVFPKDILPAPRSWGERWFNIVHWSEAASGGHFGAWDEPEQFVHDIRTFADRVLGGTGSPSDP
ncbi:epoxide hydrolase [Bradyrhizobium sp. CCGB12]|uniref:epoxide hydrolase family protein n=1 Tax=Bradyrhizobium sp. CCGB12 TaxID=2949632 RepID=UPI0020B450FE|nr:epoxide hydrolase family protein [Bradyrhizobium sp. CCGB12]MCP3392367.1 epoxide hydrolase [Bradyrhizobium sp. CCGB12]